MGGASSLNSPAYQLRMARPGDAAKCVALDQKFSPVFKQADSYLRLIDGKGCVFVCEQGNKLIGIAALASGVDAAELLNLVVATAMRRNGCALALLRRACAWAQDREQTRMLLEIRAGNSSARLLYKKFGFETDGVRAKYYLDAASGLREDAILMSKELASELGNVDTHT